MTHCPGHHHFHSEGYGNLHRRKGSITIDGISLTVVSVGNSQFSVSIIPHTMANTTLMDKHPGAIVNLETDVIGKYVHRFTVGSPQTSSGLTLDKLLENGF